MMSSPLPVFEEVLAEDGYADMYAIMKQLVACDCNAVISIDHGFKPIEGFGGIPGSFCYPTGFMKGLIYAAEKSLASAELRKISEKRSAAFRSCCPFSIPFSSIQNSFGKREGGIAGGRAETKVQAGDRQKIL